MDNTHLNRESYILAVERESPRTKHSVMILDNVGFHRVHLQDIIPHPTSVAKSNILGMKAIYQRILDKDLDWAYVFEDDINLLCNIDITEIAQYEQLSTDHFFYLGCCGSNPQNTKPTKHKINDHTVYQVSGAGIRGLHGIGVSKQGIHTILEYINKHENSIPYLDVILGRITQDIPTNIVRADLCSPYWKDHVGAFFQDRKQFPSQWESTNWNLK